jgi:hypothetical protein
VLRFLIQSHGGQQVVRNDEEDEASNRRVAGTADECSPVVTVSF